MAALDFPASPTLNQTYTANGRTWTWDGTSWNSTPISNVIVSVVGTANEITATTVSGTTTLSLPSALTFTGKTITGGTFNSGAFNGTVGATTAATGAFTTVTATTPIAGTSGGTGNGFTKFSGPASSEKTFTLPNANATLLYDGGALGTPSSGVATNITGQVADVSIVAFGAATARAAASYGDFPFGIKLQRAVTFSSVTFRAATADASGNLVVELRKNGTQVSGSSTTIAAASQVAGGTSTGTWAFAAGDIITVYVTGIGTTPGKGLIADVKGVTA